MEPVEGHHHQHHRLHSVWIFAGRFLDKNWQDKSSGSSDLADRVRAEFLYREPAVLPSDARLGRDRRHNEYTGHGTGRSSVAEFAQAYAVGPIRKLCGISFQREKDLELTQRPLYR